MTRALITQAEDALQAMWDHFGDLSDNDMLGMPCKDALVKCRSAMTAIKKAKAATVPIALGFRLGGGLIFVIKDDRVELLQVPIGVAENDPLPVTGVINREHLALVAIEILKAMQNV